MVPFFGFLVISPELMFGGKVDAAMSRRLSG